MKHSSFLKLAVAAGAATTFGVAIVGVSAAPSGWVAIDGSIRKSGAAIDWANPGSGPPFPAPCPAAGTIVSVSGTGGLFNGGTCSGSNTVPPTAPSRTATATGPTVISSSFIVDPESGDTTACGSGDPTTTGGKNGDAIASYDVTVGSVNNKTDLSNVYAVAHTRADGHPEIYFGAERLVNNGEAHVDFEFLQSTFSLTPCDTGVGALDGHRTQGDILVAVDFTNGGTLAGFSVRQWHCAVDPGPQPADGTVCDPSGGPEHYEVITTTTEVDLAVNAVDVPCGGWVCRDDVGAPIAMVPVNDLMEGGIDLRALAFTGCFNTFLPHTRVSAPFSASLADFAGPVALKTCRDPVSNSSPGGTRAPGASVRDVVTLSNGGVAVKPTGTVTYFLCVPSQVTVAGCSGGTQVGGPKALVGGVATSDPTTSTQTLGKYCWRTVYTPDAASLGIYAPGTHTNASSECFNIAAPVSLPNTGGIARQVEPQVPWQLLLAVPGLVLGLGWRRSRAVAAIVVAGVIVGSSPAAPSASMSPRNAGVAKASPQVEHGTPTPQLGTVKARPAGWRLVIPRIGVDAVIQSVGRDSHGAMAAPSGLDVVGWYRHGPLPGQAGDSVIDGHFGLPSEPAVFRELHLLRPGDGISVVWPDGRTVKFRVTASDLVDADAHPAGLFVRGGPARLSLITCAGDWDQDAASYTDRLIVTAVPV